MKVQYVNLKVVIVYFTADFMLHLLKMNSNSSISLPVLMNELELNLLQIKLMLLNNTIGIVPVKRGSLNQSWLIKTPEDFVSQYYFQNEQTSLLLSQ